MNEPVKDPEKEPEPAPTHKFFGTLQYCLRCGRSRRHPNHKQARES